MALINPNRGASALALVAGYVDTLGFVALFGLFTAHVTGNFVLIGSELAKPGHGVLLKLLVFPAFILAVALSRLISLHYERRARSPVRLLLMLEAVLLLAFMAAGMQAAPIASPGTPMAIIAGLAGAMAMGIQNGLGRLALAKLTPTTVMTGNVTQLVIDLVDMAIGSTKTETRARIIKQLGPITGFGLGALAGALGYEHLGFMALLAPITLVAALALEPSTLTPPEPIQGSATL
ncbi:YoaK family protein [Andreprevotia chitinilytica]|uniref:YoaK family protein n=1 Tax=Andreprevotia chitinilytica TaxID=396808 RepID=UPI00068A980E|nr:YoaK family protein [Andreprevotia chitinilytica]